MGKYFKNTKNNYMIPHGITGLPDFIKLPLSTKHIYTILCKIANQNANESGWFWHDIDKIAEKAGVKRRTVTEAKRVLLKKKYIDVKRRYSEQSNKRLFDFYKISGFVFKEENTNQ